MDDDDLLEMQEALRIRAEIALNDRNYRAAIGFHQRELTIMQNRLGINSWEVLQLKVKMAGILANQTKQSAAEGIHREILATTNFLLVNSEMRSEDDRFRLLARDTIIWLRDRAIVHFNNSKYQNADLLLRDTYDAARAILSDVDPISTDIRDKLEINVRKLVTTSTEKTSHGSSVGGTTELGDSQGFKPLEASNVSADIAVVDSQRTEALEVVSQDVPENNSGKFGFDDNVLLALPDDPVANKLSDLWFKNSLERHTQRLLQPSRGGNYRRVRVAVIDSGIDMNHENVISCKDRIISCRSWVPCEPGNVDDSGHGTHVAMLLLNVAPETDLYVARVFSRTHRDTSKGISLAIKCAVEEWEVDIISMSFGSVVTNPEIEAAIGLAAYRNVLMFAAASNNGKLERIQRAYPARDYRVFDIGSTDVYGNASAFNPEPEDGELNFCVLGEYVNSATIKGKMVRKSGTSMATPIAAGIAALFLEFVRQPRVEAEMGVEDADSIRTFQGMRSVLKATSIDVGRYKCLAPWRILSTQRSLSDILLEARNRAALQITELLRER